MSLTHFDAAGQAHMVDVSAKPATAREAVAEGAVVMSPATLTLAQGGAAKGDVLGVARLAGIMGAKRTADLIPLCHPLPITKVALELTPDPALPGIRIRSTVRTAGQTGVEMEALTAVTIAALTVYDMLKAAEKGMRIEGVRLLTKTGGKSGAWQAEDAGVEGGTARHGAATDVPVEDVLVGDVLVGDVRTGNVLAGQPSDGANRDAGNAPAAGNAAPPSAATGANAAAPASPRSPGTAR